MSYVFIKSEPQLWTVGYYGPSGQWVSESDHGNEKDAAHRVHWLNGGHTDNAELLEALKAAEKLLAPIVGAMSIRKNFHEKNVLENTIRAAIAKAEGVAPCPTN